MATSPPAATPARAPISDRTVLTTNHWEQKARRLVANETILHRERDMGHHLTRALGKNLPCRSTDRYLCTAGEKKSIMQTRPNKFAASNGADVSSTSQRLPTRGLIS